eukprot:TRINITY_DN55440_c0_g1_i1.p1 TRINITY_DN55440_c0_g1~~TRINITY_DN55440_c0_g1_i1.p1  ORF type:complete len:178 (-),score=16.47 TRINITY_DN55440_c0_g1_i1:36-527(-)
MIKLIKKILDLSEKYKSQIIVAFILSIIKAMASKAPIFLGFYTLSKFYNNTLEKNDCINIFIGMVCIIIIQMLSQYISDVLQSSAGYKIFADKRIKLGEHLRKLPMGYFTEGNICLLYTSDAADDTPCVDLGGRRIIKKKTQNKKRQSADTTSKCTKAQTIKT